MLVDFELGLFLFPGVSVSPIDMSVHITTSGDMVLGQSDYSLICGVTVTGTENPSIAYQWTKSNGTQTQVGTDRVLFFSLLRLSDAGHYTCQATVSRSSCNITKMDIQDVTLQSESYYRLKHTGI